MKTCKNDNCDYPVFGKGYCKSHQYLRKDKDVKKIAVMSKKLSEERKIYRKLRIEFLNRIENKFCAVFPHLQSTEIHHKAGRGKNLNRTETWLAVSRDGHLWVESNRKLAEERGFTKSRLKLTDNLNDQDK